MAMDPYKEQVQARPYSTTLLQPTGDSSGGRAMGAAMGNLGQGLGQVAGALDARETLLADTEAREAFRGFARERNDLLYGPNGYMNRRGGNGIDIMAEAQTDLEALHKRHSDAVTNPRARRLFDQRAADLRLSDEEGVLRYSAGQTEKYITDERQATAALEVENAALAYADPVKFEEHLGKAGAEIAALGELQGWSPAQVQQEQDKATSVAVTARVLRLATDDPIAAAGILEQERGRLSAQHQQQLDNALKEPVAEAQAAAVVASYIGPPQPQRGFPRAAGPRDETEALIVRAESGGRMDAQNPGSSAAGPHQFLASTFVGQARKMQREGRAPWAEGLSDAELAAIRMPSNEREQALEQSVYDDFRADGVAAIRAVGAAVTPVTEYIMHHFGAGGGRSILKALTGNPAALVNAVLPNAAGVRAVNPWMKGAQTVGQLADAAARFLGVDPRSTAGNYIDEAAAVDAISQIEDPLVRRKAIGQLNEWMGLENTAKEIAAQSAFDSAWQEYKINGTTTIPLDQQLEMGPGKLASLQATIAAERAGALTTDPAVYEHLVNMATNDRQTFASTDLRDYWPALSEGDRKRFTDMRASTQAALAGEAAANDPMLIPFADNWSAAQDIIDVLGLKVTGEKAREDDIKTRNEVRRRFDQMQIEFSKREARHPNPQEVLQMARELVTPVALRGTGAFGAGETALGATGRLEPGVTFVADRKIADIPPEERQEVVAYLEAQGMQPTTANIEQAANLRSQVLHAGGVQAIEDVPREFRQGAAGMDDETVIALFNQYMLEVFGP